METQIAVIVKDLDYLGKRIGTLTDVVQKFIEVSEKKVDRETYLIDKQFQFKVNERVDKQLNVLEDFRKGFENGMSARKEEREKILGIGTGTLAVMIQILSFFTLLAGVVTIFREVSH